MRELDVREIIEPIAQACVRANRELPARLIALLESAQASESCAAASQILATLVENARIAPVIGLPTCQDTGMVAVFVELGQGLRLTGGDLSEAVNEGVRRGYAQGHLRQSVLADPLRRGPNTGDNTPAVIHLRLVAGDRLSIHLVPKGGGAENMSALWMLRPSDGVEGVVEAIVERIRFAGGKPCPPLVLGVGVGGTFEKSALLAKEALLRDVGAPNPDPELAAIERRILAEVNATGVGPMGLGGDTTALAVHLLTYPCHITSLPVALNVQCHAARAAHVEVTF